MISIVVPSVHSSLYRLQKEFNLPTSRDRGRSAGTLNHSGRLAGHEPGRTALHCHWLITCLSTADQEARCTGDGQRVAIA